MQTSSSCVQWRRVAIPSDFRFSDKKKLGAVKFGEHAGQGVSPEREIKRPGNIPLRKVMICLAEWALEPSC